MPRLHQRDPEEWEEPDVVSDQLDARATRSMRSRRHRSQFPKDRDPPEYGSWRSYYSHEEMRRDLTWALLAVWVAIHVGGLAFIAAAPAAIAERLMNTLLYIMGTSNAMLGTAVAFWFAKRKGRR